MKKNNLKNNQYPFPFIGAGIGNYYEWCEIDIRFFNAPTKEEIKEIIKLAPGPIKPIQSDLSGKMLCAGSDQFVNMWIEEEYGSSKKVAKNDEVEDDYLDNEFEVSPEAHAAFEAHIEKWLHETHAICPIEIAFRHEDWEAGGTELSAWHEKSLLAIPDLLEKWSNDEETFKQKKDEIESFQFLLSGLLQYEQIKEEELSERMLIAFFPEKVLTQLFAKGDVNQIIDFIKANKKNNEILSAVNKQFEQLARNKNYSQLVKLSDFWIDLVTLNEKFIADYEVLGAICYLAIAKNDVEFKAKIVKKLSNQSAMAFGNTASCNFANNLCAYIFELHGKESWTLVLEFYQMALDIETDKPCTGNLQLYCNALWAAQSDNNGLPVNKVLNESFLKKCLPYGPASPGIYFNAACLWVEMKDYDKALEYVKLACEYKYNMYDNMITQITKTEKMFEGFRKYKPFLAWLTVNKNSKIQKDDKVMIKESSMVRQIREEYRMEKLPNTLQRLIEFQDTSAFEDYADGFGIIADDLNHWSTATEFQDKLKVLGQANGSGSQYAFWENEKGKPLDEMPIIVFGDEGGVHVVAENLLQLMQLLTLDSEISVDFDDVYFYKDPEYDGTTDHDKYIVWLKGNFNIDLVNEEEANKMIANAQKKYKSTFDAWVKQFIEM